MTGSISVNEPAPSQRLVSLDALRGLDMAFIIGLGGVVAAIATACGMPELALQFKHAEWEGFRFEDLIFPLFIFISGVSLNLSLSRSIDKHGRKGAALRLVRRCAVLFLIGVIMNGGFSKGIENVRWMGVLQRIALATLGAGLLYVHFQNVRDLVTATVALLAGYWALLTFTNGGSYAEGANFVNQFDAKWLAGRKYDGTHDPEGLLSTFPAVATALLGVLAGMWLGGVAPAGKKVLVLALTGAALLLAGWAWGWKMPIIKKLWTSSFVLVAAGWSTLLLAFFYLIAEVIGWQRWAAPWVWIGSNSITMYVVANIARPFALAERFTGAQSEPYRWITHLVAFLLLLLLARFLYKRQVFIRV
jgi:predicted acyltransferase